jgi:hypothetical protein
VETDGYGPHGTPRRFETDRARDAHLTALGYSSRRLTQPSDPFARRIGYNPVPTERPRSAKAP